MSIGEYLQDFFDGEDNLYKELDKELSGLVELYNECGQDNARLAREAINYALESGGDFDKARDFAKRAKGWFGAAERLERI